ncbi:Macrolide export ATP-binding/permease protein MacB [termite gut metagenome]|uniref:Macrolide export ATP-binding/permease protein MacB n=1 Tax=termite gut metagenome TaxID=433724 RepID=A0A5J4QQ64_9ZZZZ
MYQQYFKQALYTLRENKLFSFISIFGTALAIAIIMAVVITQRVQTENYEPEMNRDRTLYVKWMSTHWNNDAGLSNGPMSLRTAKACFKSLTTPETVCILSFPNSYLASVAEGELMTVDLQQTDEAFWQIFSFSFLNGKPYDKADCDAGITKAVITETVARKLFKTTDVTGRTIRLDYADYTVAAVVKNVSKLAVTAYAQVWIPYTTTKITDQTWSNDVMGMMRIMILARSPLDFPLIRKEVEQLRLKYNDLLAVNNQAVKYQDQPDTQFVYNNRKGADVAPNIKRIVIQYIVVIALLLLVPAINLSGMTLSRMRKRFPEIAVRKAFGANQGELIGQILWENLVLTLIGGVIGLILSYGAAFVLNDLLFANALRNTVGGQNTVSAAMLLDPMLFLSAFLFCFVLNLLSAGIPAWRAARMNIVTALNS